MTAVALALTTLLAQARCHETVVRRAKPMMATYVSIVARGCDETELEEGIRAAFAEMQRLASILSEWDPASPVSRLSAQAGITSVQVPPELMQVLEASRQASELTGGAFDVTWASLAELWHFAGKPMLPDPAEVTRRRNLVDYRDLVLEEGPGRASLRRKDMRIGLGGVAKGYIAAAAADLLVRRGIRDVRVAASGDIAARGTDGDQPWRVAVQDPRRPDRSVASVELHDQSISTAGDYEHCFFLGGRRYHHILDPKTGYPTSGTASVSVLSDSGVLADALDTGLLVLGTRAGSEVAGHLPRIGALFVDDEGRIQTAGPLGERFQLESRASPLRPDQRGSAPRDIDVTRRAEHTPVAPGPL